LQIIAFTISYLLLLTGTVEANSANEFYDYTYKVKLSKTQVQVNETFAAQVESQGTCKENLPATVNEGIIKGKIIAHHRTSNIEVILNPEFEIKFDGIPSLAGESFKKDINVTLVFPPNSQPGIYDITAQTTSAMFQVLFFWVDGLSYLPTDPMSVGAIECLAGSQTTNSPTISSPTISSTTVNSPTITEQSPAVSSTSTSEISTGNVSPVTPANIPEDKNQRERNLWPWIGGIGGGVVVVGLISWQGFSYIRRKRSKV
jgi:hypothetical protein